MADQVDVYEVWRGSTKLRTILVAHWDSSADVIALAEPWIPSVRWLEKAAGEVFDDRNY